MLRMTPQEVFAAAVERREAGPGSTPTTSSSPPRTPPGRDPQFIIEICQAAVEAGATTINIPDTVGYATPSRVRRHAEPGSTREVQGDNDDVIVSTHCHNDLGLAVANSLSAIHAGARQIEGAINGIGERAGNTSTEEIIMAVKTREDYFGVEIGADTTRDLRDVAAGVAPHRLPDSVQQGGRWPQRLRPRVGDPPARRAAGPRNVRDHGSGGDRSRQR